MGMDAWGDDTEALVACRQLGIELGHATVSGWSAPRALSYINTPNGSGRIWWSNVRCSGSEETLEKCQGTGSRTSDYRHKYDIGIECKFLQADECDACPTGKFSDTVGIISCMNCRAGKYR